MDGFSIFIDLRCKRKKRYSSWGRRVKIVPESFGCETVVIRLFELVALTWCPLPL